MADQYYDSPLTGEQLDAAFLQMQNIQQTASQVQTNATAAAQSASQASQSANSASQSASQARTSAQSASESQTEAATSANEAAESAKDAAASAASIEGDVEQAAASANAASQSATQAASSASSAAASASAAADSEDEVQANAAAAQQAAASASESEGNAKASETAAASSAETAAGAASAAQTSETNAAESARQAAASVASIGDDVATSAANAQAAQQAASAASASAAAAEDAATRAEQIADFDPSDFATAAQGTKADTAVQSVNGKTGTAITLAAADVGAATAAQGSLAETAVQPDALDAYALKTDVPDTPADIGAATAAQGAKADSAVQSVNGQEPDTQGNVQITIPPAGVTSVNGKTGAVTLSAADVDAAQEPLTGDITNVTPAQVREALQAGRQVILTVNSSNDILAAWVDTGTNVQCLYGWDIGAYTNRPRAFSTDAYSGKPTGSNTWSYEKLYGNVLPEVTSADNGKTVVVQNGQWNLGTAGGGGKFDFVANTGFTSWSEGNQYHSSALYTGGYDAVGIEFYPNYATDTDVFSPMQVFPIPENGQSRKYGVVCMDVNSSPMGEAQTRIIEIQNNGSGGIKITSVTGGYYYNWGNRGTDDKCAVPARIYGIKY